MSTFGTSKLYKCISNQKIWDWYNGQAWIVRSVKYGITPASRLNRQYTRSDYLSQATIIWRVGALHSDNDELQRDSSNKVNYESHYSCHFTITTIKIFSHSTTYAGASFYNAMEARFSNAYHIVDKQNQWTFEDIYYTTALCQSIHSVIGIIHAYCKANWILLLEIQSTNGTLKTCNQGTASFNYIQSCRVF